MASGTTTRVFISDILIIEALNTPGGSGKVYAYMDGFADYVKTYAMALAPVNNPLKAKHRGGVVGTYKASFKWDRKGSGGHSVRRVVYNTAKHAKYVEFGRPDTKWGLSYQMDKWFSSKEKGGRFEAKDGKWEAFSMPGGVGGFTYIAVKGTPARKGHHTLRDATILARQTYRFNSATFRPYRPSIL